MPPTTVDVGERLPCCRASRSVSSARSPCSAPALVPYLVGLDTSVTLFTSGVGTLVYILVTRGRIPAYLGSSFASSPRSRALLGAQVGAPAAADRIGAAMSGCVTVGLLYILVALAVGRFGTGFIDGSCRPSSSAPVVVVIGLGLAGVAVEMATKGAGPAHRVDFFGVALAALALAVVAAMFFEGFLGLVPILVGIVGGYAVAPELGQVDLSPVATARAFAVPPFVLPWLSRAAVLTLAPISLVGENIGAHKRNLVISSVILVLGIGGAHVRIGGVELHGMPLPTYVGILLNLVLPRAAETAGAPVRPRGARRRTTREPRGGGDRSAAPPPGR